MTNQEQHEKKGRCDMCGEPTELARLQKSNLYSDLEYCERCYGYAEQWEQNKKPKFERIIQDRIKEMRDITNEDWRDADYS